MKYKTRLYGKTYEFDSIKHVLNQASEQKSGDALAGIGAQNRLENIAAKVILSECTVHDLREAPSVPYEEDSITRLIQDDLDQNAYRKVENWSIAKLREWILSDKTSGEMIREISGGLTSEVISAVSKLMGNLDLIYAGNKMEITATCNTVIGKTGTLSSRLQPNHPSDDPKGVIASALEGLSYGVGDAVLGMNPAIDTIESTTRIWDVLYELKNKYEIPTQTCVLSHVKTQMEALRRGGKADLCFQSLAGTQKACEAFGITIEMLEEANVLFRSQGMASGTNVMYFETGQGSELSSLAHYDTDQVTMECRCYGLARHFAPFLVNTVVGFMGPEYIYDTKQLTRAGLEDVFNGHLHGLPMGCDICYTNHMPVDQNDAETLAVLLANAGCHYIMGVPQGDDVMLMYQSTGYQDVAAIREIANKRPIREFEVWLEKWGFLENGRLGPHAGDPTVLLSYKMGGR